MWAPPGKTGNPDRWRYDVAKKSFLPPGAVSGPKGTQVEMPGSYTGSEPRGFHMLASPAGTQAPIEHINFTPDTGEVHGRGAPAPREMLNYTLMPREALQGSVGASEGAGNMGAGAVGALDAFGAPPPFSGTPPLVGSLQMMGPSPTTNRAAPNWGGGGTPFDMRMGMGADDDDPDLLDTVNPVVTPGQGARPVTPAGSPTPVATPGAPAAPAAPAGGGFNQTLTPATPTGPTGINSSTVFDPDKPPQPNPAAGPPPPAGTPLKADGTPMKQDDFIPLIDPVTKSIIGYKVYDGYDQVNRTAKWHYINGPDPIKPKEPMHIKNDDGSIDAIDFSTKPPTTTRIQQPDPKLVVKAEMEAKLQEALLRKRELEAKSAAAKDVNAVQLADIELQTQLTQLATAQTNLDRAATEAGLAGQAPKATPVAKVTDRTGRVFERDPDTGTLVDTGIIEAQGTWQMYPNSQTGTMNLFNPETKENIVLHPLDMYKEYPPQKADGGKWIQWDPATKAYKTVYQEDPTWVTDWSGDELIARNPATNEVKVIWQKTQTLEQKDAHDAAVDAHNLAMINIDKTKQDMLTGRITSAEARVRLETSLQNLLHPGPVSFGSHGSYYLPQGAEIDVDHFEPVTGRKWTTHESGGPADPRIARMLSEVDTMIEGWNAAAVRPQPGAQPQQTAPPPPTAAPPVATPPGAADESVGAQMGGDQSMLPPGQTGVPGWDPNLSGQARPPQKITRAEGTRDIVDAEGNVRPLGGMTTEEIPLTRDFIDDEDVGENASFGFGNEGKMGAGMAAGATGWAPRASVFAPATGPGFPGGAGAEDDEAYDADGNPIIRGLKGLLKGVAGTTTKPKPITGGHVPGPEPKLPGELIQTPPRPTTGGHTPGAKPNIPGMTDQGGKWKPELKDEVTQRVHEPLNELMGWPKLEAEKSPLLGLQGGFDQPEIDPVNTQTGEEYETEDASDIGDRPPHVRDVSHVLGEGGMDTELWDEIEAEEGLSRGTARNKGTIDPDAQRILEESRRKHETTGMGQEAPGATMPLPPQGPGGEQPPAWLLNLLRKRPELLQMAGLPSGGPPASGGAPPQPGPPPGAAGAPSPDLSAGGAPGLPPPSAPPAAGWAPPGGAPPPGGPPTGGGAPVAPSPEGAPMSPPLPPQDVAGIGHRFGQDMNVGEPQHSGVDLQAPEGTPTKSPVDGFVANVENNPEGLGVTVVIKGMDGSEHRLGHLKSTTAFRGQQVARGQDLGSPVGETGMTTGAHLHWGVKDGQGQPSDPTAALGPMAQMPPVPGTEMMGPPGGVGGAAQQGAPMMGGGQEDSTFGAGPYDATPLESDAEPLRFGDPRADDDAYTWTPPTATKQWMTQEAEDREGTHDLTAPYGGGMTRRPDLDQGAFGGGQEQGPPPPSPGAMPTSIGQMMAQSMFGRGAQPPPGGPQQQQKPPPSQPEGLPAMAGAGADSKRKQVGWRPPRVGAGQMQGGDSMGILRQMLAQEWQRMRSERAA